MMPGAIMSRKSLIFTSSCGGDWRFLFLAISISSFLILILGIRKAATFMTAWGKWVHFRKEVRYNKTIFSLIQIHLILYNREEK